MNKEYMHLSDGKVALTNEEGNIEIREFENKGLVKQILQYENADEFFDNELKKYKKNLDEQERVQYLCKKMIKFQPLIVVLFTLFGFIYGGAFTADFLANAIYNGTFAFVLSSFLCGGTLTYFVISKNKSKNEIKALEEVIKDIEKNKEQYQNILKSLNKLQSKDLSENINTPVSLEENTIIEKAKDDINNTYEKAIKPKTKRLVLSRKRK